MLSDLKRIRYCEIQGFLCVTLDYENLLKSYLPSLNSAQMRRLLNIAARETTIKNVEDLHITGSHAYKMSENSKASLKHLTKRLPPEQLMEEMMKLSKN